MAGETIATATAPSSASSVIKAARIALRAALFLVVLIWVASVPTMLRVAVFPEQFMSLVIGIATAIVLLDDYTWRHGPHRLLRGLDIAAAAAVLAIAIWVAAIFPNLPFALWNKPVAVVISTLSLALVLEATRRKTGPVLPILVLLMLVFAFLGPNLPAAFETRAVTFPRLMVYLALDGTAMMGRVMVIAVVIVIPFIVFGYLLNAFGGSTFFTGLATILVGRFRGGPAKVSVVGSAAFGMISGSAVANVVSVGSVSIPLMARTGYRKHVAAAIEAVTSTGGQLMPPIMGASAFLMAELLEVPYRDIVAAAILPAVFFYITLFLAVDFEARRMNIRPQSLQSLGFDPGRGWLGGAKFLIPVAVLLYLLFIERQTAAFASVRTVAALMLVYLVLPPRDLVARVKKLVTATLGAMGAATDIVLLAAAAGLIIGILNITGFSFAVTVQMLVISGDRLPVLLTLAALLSLLLGMGMPTVGVYILLAILAAPSLIELGVTPMAAHLYVLYFGMLSMITPPVAIASFTAASVAQANPWSTSFASVRVAAGVYLVPIAFVTQPELLLLGDGLTSTLIAGIRLLLAVSLLTAVFVGHGVRAMPLPLRFIGAPVAVLNVMPLTGASFDPYLWAAAAAALGLLAVNIIGKRAADPVTA